MVGGAEETPGSFEMGIFDASGFQLYTPHSHSLFRMVPRDSLRLGVQIAMEGWSVHGHVSAVELLFYLKQVCNGYLV